SGVAIRRTAGRCPGDSSTGGLRRLLDAVIVVKPETVIRWHRTGWRLLWRWRSRRPRGRPPIDLDLRHLIRRMWRENATCGEDLIRGELAKLGAKHLPPLRPPPGTRIVATPILGGLDHR